MLLLADVAVPGQEPQHNSNPFFQSEKDGMTPVPVGYSRKLEGNAAARNGVVDDDGSWMGGADAHHIPPLEMRLAVAG